MGDTEFAAPITQVSSGRCLERRRIQCECADNMRFLSLFDCFIRKSFRRLPTTTEWVRFRKYARRMRELGHSVTPDCPSPELFSVVQLFAIKEPLFPNLKTLHFLGILVHSIPFIPLFLSQRTTSITLRFESNLSEATVASMITILPTLCPELQAIALRDLPRDPMVTAAVFGMLLVTNRNTLQELDIDSPLTTEANEVLHKLPNLLNLSVAIEKETPLPSASLPNLIGLTIRCDDEDNWPRLFHGATFGKLKSVSFYPRSKQIGNFLGAFERAALSSSIHNTLSTFYLSTPCSWNPNYSSLLPFTQMVDLEIEFSCDGGCSSRVDDDIIISLSRAMPKLKYLGLGNAPCRQSTAGVTTKGLLALAHHCPNLGALRVHLRVASLSEPLAIPGTVPGVGPVASWMDCALTELEVGATPVPKGLAMIIALTLLRIFPQLDSIQFISGGWKEVNNAISLSKEIIDCSSKQRPFTMP